MQKLYKEDYLINWNEPALNIHRKIMGLFPNAYSYIREKRIKIEETIPLIDLVKKH